MSSHHDAARPVSPNLRVRGPAMTVAVGRTRPQVAERLAGFTGHRLPQASISQMERSFECERRRRFNAHDLYLLSKVFAVPIVYFFLPPPPCLDQTVARTSLPGVTTSVACRRPTATPGSMRSRIFSRS